MSAAAEHDSKEPYSSDSDESEDQQSPAPEDVDHEEGEEDDDEDIGGLTEAERQEMERLNSQLDFLNVALDEFEQKNSDLQQRLMEFLTQNSAPGADDKAAASPPATSDDAKDESATDSADKS